MKVANNKFVSLTYTLTVDGQIADQATAERPLSFVFGTGMLLPKFEANIEGKIAGDKFAFTLTPEEGYGEYIAEAVVDLPKDIFLINGKFDEEMIKEGVVLPMTDAEGNRMPGTVKSINESTVTMDFNHPMADKTLNFEGEILVVRDSKPEDMMPAGGSCSGCHCDGDCDSDGGSCGCGGCH